MNNLKLLLKQSSYALIFALMMTPCVASAQVTPFSQMEKIDRGVVALPAAKKGVFVSWRLLGTDAKDVYFDLKRDGKTIVHHIKATNYTDTKGTVKSSYQVVTYQNGQSETSKTIVPWGNLYKSIPINRPNDETMPDGKVCNYTPNDCSVGDVDGDGEYELILKWDPSNSHDNAHNGYTGNVYIDCYKLDGKQLWRINLGKNIRAGAHYTQILVYDFNGDGQVEMICKTAPGSVDSKGQYVSSAATDDAIKQIDNTQDYRTTLGRILDGEELLTVFNGLTGEAIHTVWYNPNRAYGLGGKAEYAGWGDRANMGNRGERFLACVAFLDGADKKPSAVMCRGYYTRSYLWAVDFDGKHLSTKWLHASLSKNDYTVTDGEGKIIKEEYGLQNTAYGQGAHSVAVADVDGDGCDEITYGSCAIDHNGTLLYSTGLGHGDAQHLGDLDPDRPGLEYYMVHEENPHGADLRDARTGEILYREFGTEDTGRGIAADIDANHRGFEFWCSDSRQVRDIKGNVIGEASLPMNFRIYWDGDLQDELLGDNRKPPFCQSFLVKWNGKEGVKLPLSNGKHFYEMGNSVSNNWTKANPNLQADILGDWREEIILWDKSDAAHLNIFTTNTPTDYRVPCLMHDHVYRMGVAWQNVTYNQPPHLGYYLPDKAEKVK